MCHILYKQRQFSWTIYEWKAPEGVTRRLLFFITIPAQEKREHYDQRTDFQEVRKELPKESPEYYQILFVKR